MHLIWTLYSRRIFSRLAYWLSALGYNVRDRSLNNRIYLVYFIIFWAVWVGAVFAMLASTLAGGLVQATHSPLHVVPLFAMLLLAGWSFLQLWRVTHRSPFVFSEEDAYLLCQSPVSRRQVGFVVYLQGWLGSLTPFLAGAVILAFTQVEIQLLLAEETFVLGKYLLGSVRAVSIIIPLQAGLSALLWGIGAYRLHPRRRTWLGWIALLGLILSAVAIGLRHCLPLTYAILSFPLRLVVDAALGAVAASWITGFSFSVLLLILGLLCLYLTTPRMSLAQAARETSLRALIRSARDYGNNEFADALVLRRRLGVGRSPSGLLESVGAGVLFEKDQVQTRRSLTVGYLFNLLWVFSLSFGMFTSPTWQVQLILGGVWSLAVGSLLNCRLRSDLACWWILRSLPLKPTTLLRTEMRLPWTLVVWLGWVCAYASPAQLGIKILAMVMIPFLASSAGYAVASDILRRCQARTIMSPGISEENIPSMDIKGALLAIASVVIPYAVLLTLIANPSRGELGFVAVILTLALAWLNHRSAVFAFANVG